MMSGASSDWTPTQLYAQGVIQSARRKVSVREDMECLISDICQFGDINLAFSAAHKSVVAQQNLDVLLDGDYWNSPNSPEHSSEPIIGHGCDR